MDQAVVAAAIFMQTLAPSSQTVTIDPPATSPAPVVQVQQNDNKKPKPNPKSNKGNLSLVFSGVSHHFGQRGYFENGEFRHFNEVNPGGGVEIGIGKVGPLDAHVSAGFYKNSVYRTSKYLAVGIETPGSKFLGAGIDAGILTGYPDMPVPVAAVPYVRIGGADKANLKVDVIPPIKNLTPMTVGVQLRIPLGPK